MPEKKVMTVEDVANYLSLHPQTVARMAAKGELPAAKFGRVWRFRRQDIEAYIERKLAEQASHTQVGALAAVGMA